MTVREELSKEDRRYRMSWILWSAFTASIALYQAVALLVQPAGVANNANVEHVLMILAAAYVLLSIPAKRVLRAQAHAVDSTLIRGLSEIVPLVLCEAAAVTGLVLRLASGSPHYYVFLLLALAGMLLNLPRRER